MGQYLSRNSTGAEPTTPAGFRHFQLGVRRKSGLVNLDPVVVDRLALLAYNAAKLRFESKQQNDKSLQSIYEERDIEIANLIPSFPDYYLQSFERNSEIKNLITPADIPVLKHLIDVTLEPSKLDSRGFKMAFTFSSGNGIIAPGPYTKHFIVKPAEGCEALNPFDLNPQSRSNIVQIDWEVSPNPIDLHPRKKGYPEDSRFRNESFFHFFLESNSATYQEILDDFSKLDFFDNQTRIATIFRSWYEKREFFSREDVPSPEISGLDRIDMDFDCDSSYQGSENSDHLYHFEDEDSSEN